MTDKTRKSSFHVDALALSVDGPSRYWTSRDSSRAHTTNSPPPTPPASFGTVAYYHTDAIGSVRMVTDTNQQATRHDYLPFGQESPSGVQEFRLFGGKEHDLATGFDYFGGRYYAGGHGRFTTVDPVLDADSALANPQLWNRYTYGLDNPLKFTDPDGRNPVLVTGGIGAAVYAAWNT